MGIDYESDLAAARRVATATVRSVEGVAADPAPEVLYTALGESTVDLEVLFWCDARQLEMRPTVARAIEAVKDAFDEHGIEIPYPIVALRATSTFEAALRGRAVTPGGAVEGEDPLAATSRRSG